jgi:hypothetical protein
MRRFLLHVLPDGFHRIRHYGLLANPRRRESLARIRTLLAVPDDGKTTADQKLLPDQVVPPAFVCPCCGGAMVVIETWPRCQPIRAPPRSQSPP